MRFNIFDVVVIAILALCIYSGYRRGLIHMVFRLFSMAISIMLANYIYPIAGNLMRGTAFYEAIKQWIIEYMGLDTFLQEQTAKAQTDLINSLSIPDFITKSILANNNPEVHKLLDVSGVTDYIGGYFANIVINILAFVLVLIAVQILMRIASGILGLVTEIPVIKAVNKLGGLAAGLAEGTLLIWLGFVIMVIFFLKPEYGVLFEQLNESVVALRFFENNLLMNVMFNIFA